MTHDSPDFLSRITMGSGKCGGRPCIRGKRLHVSDVLELLGAGASIEEILGDYPFLEREDVLATLQYAPHQTDQLSKVDRKVEASWAEAHA